MKALAARKGHDVSSKREMSSNMGSISKEDMTKSFGEEEVI